MGRDRGRAGGVGRADISGRYRALFEQPDHRLVPDGHLARFRSQLRMLLRNPVQQREEIGLVPDQIQGFLRKLHGLGEAPGLLRTNGKVVELLRILFSRGIRFPRLARGAEGAGHEDAHEPETYEHPPGKQVAQERPTRGFWGHGLGSDDSHGRCRGPLVCYPTKP